MGFRGIERVKGVHHTTIIYWVEQLGEKLPDVPKEDIIPEVGELDELETFVSSKKTLIGLWTAVNHFTQGILAWVLGRQPVPKLLSHCGKLLNSGKVIFI